MSDEDKMRFGEAIAEIRKDTDCTWTDLWWNSSQIIVSVPDWYWDGYRAEWRLSDRKFDSWEVKDASLYLPPTFTALGCSGLNGGNETWVGWDLDVKHGGTCYQTTQDAIQDARQIRCFLQGHAEIRLSKSGVGVHVRHKFEAPQVAGRAARFAKAIANKLNLKADPSALGRQCMWLWVKEPTAQSFQLIEPHI